MIHAFRALGLNIVMDVESGAVHCVDETAYEILSRLDSASREEIRRELSPRFSSDALDQAFDEIDGLIADGQLCTPAPEVEPAGYKGVVKALCLHVAHDCNLRCKYCFAQEGGFGRERGLMPASVGKAALDFLVRHSGARRNLEVDFFGGEPLMNFEVVREIVAYGRELEKTHDKVFKFTLTTNGINLTPEMIEYMHREMENVVISLDGRKSVHDRMRPTANGKGSFDLILPKAKMLAEDRREKSYYVRGTFSRHNLDFSKDVLFLADQGFDQVSVEPVVAPEDADYSLLPEHVAGICAEYEKLAEEYVRRRRDGRWFNFFHFNVDLAGGPCLIKRLVGCGAGNEYLAVTPTGDLYPCHQFVGDDEMRVGSVLDDTLDTRRCACFAANTVLTKPQCSQCWAKYYCSGGCAANAYHANGDIAKPYQMGCDLEKKRLECAIAVYVKEALEEQE